MAEQYDLAIKAAASLLAETAIAARRARVKQANPVTDALASLKSRASGLGASAQAGLGAAGARMQPMLDTAGRHGRTALDWATKPENAPMAGALAGAAAGGIGGIGLGMTGKRKRNPLAAGLTGALAGGAIGGGVGAVMHGVGTSTIPAGVEAAKEKADQIANSKLSPVSRAYNLGMHTIGRDVPEAANDSALGIAGAAVGTTGIAGGVAGGAAGYAVGDHKMRSDKLRNFVAGSEETLKPPKGSQAPSKPKTPFGSVTKNKPKAPDPNIKLRADAQLMADKITADAKPYSGPGVYGRYRDLEAARTATENGIPKNQFFGRSVFAGEQAAIDAAKASKGLLSGPKIGPRLGGTIKGTIGGTVAGMAAPYVFNSGVQGVKNIYGSAKSMFGGGEQ